MSHPSRCLSIPLLAILFALTAAPPAAAVDLDTAFERFYDLDLAAEGVAVQDLEIRRPDALIVLKEGVFVPAEPLEGAVTGGVFLGTGEVTVEPSEPMDRAILDRRQQEWIKKSGSTYKGQFTAAVLRFTDDTLDELGDAPAAQVDRDRAEAVWHERNGVLDNIEKLGPLGSQLALEMDFLERAVNQLDDKAFFLADFETVEDGWLFYLHHRGHIEEVFFGSRSSLGASEEVHPFLLTHEPEEFDDAGHYIMDREEDDKLTLDTEHYRLVITIPDTARMLLEASVEFTPRVPLKLARFDLVNGIQAVKWTDQSQPVHVTRIVDAQGNELRFLHKRHQILIEFPDPLPPGETATLALSAEEKTITQLTPESYQLLNTYPWFPQSGFAGGRNTHEWVVKIKKPLVAVVSGRLMREWEEDDLNCTGWMMEEEVQFPSLIFGKFRSDQDVYESESTGKKVDLRIYAIPAVGATSGLKRMQPLMNDAKQIMKLYESLFGPYPYDYLNIAQMAVGMGFGQAPPGLVQLTGEAFMSSAMLAAADVRGDFVDEFYAHEIAHQWWAHVVWGTSFRDAWLSESFAEYAAGLYIQQLRGQNAFQNKLKDWRQNAFQAVGTAPIAALATLSGDRAGQYYQQQIYYKGPYVVHMLRMQLGHDKWVEVMQNFFGKYRHTNLTTEKLIAEVDQVAGYQTDFFFNEWWKGMYLPTFDFSYDVKPTEDGRYLFTGSITQEGRPFKVLMPVFFHFDGDQISVQNRPVLEADDTYQVFLPQEPRNVTLDDFNTLLATIHQGADDKTDSSKKKHGRKGS